MTTRTLPCSRMIVALTGFMGCGKSSVGKELSVLLGMPLVDLDKYIVGEEGETFHTICQRFAVKEKAIRKLNHLPAGYQPKEGDELLLRPAPKSRKLWKKR